MFCKKCGNEILEGARFCFECGTELDEYMIKSMEEQQSSEKQVQEIPEVIDETSEETPVVVFDRKWPTVEHQEEVIAEFEPGDETKEGIKEETDVNNDDLIAVGDSANVVSTTVCVDNTEVMAAIGQLNEKLDTIIGLLKDQNKCISATNQRIDEVENTIKSMKIVF